MNSSWVSVKSDYLQRTRNHSFLITLAITVFAAYSFVPPVDAAYSTLAVPGYAGAYNAAWVGHVSAIMTTVMLSLYGFLLINSGIKKDIDSEVGLIIAATPITNFGYLFTKLMSNFLILLTIAAITFMMSMIMFLLRGRGYSFHMADFILPYTFFALPGLFLVSGLAVIAEVLLPNRTLFQFMIYFFMFAASTALIISPDKKTSSAVFDPYGLSLVTGSIKDQINTSFHQNIEQVSFGFIFSDHKGFKTVVWNGVTWTGIFIFSRLIWMLLSLALVYLSSFFFHRFDYIRRAGKKKTDISGTMTAQSIIMESAQIHLGPMPPVIRDYGILPLIKTELLLMSRKGNKLFWLPNIGLWVAMWVVPLDIAHAYLIPIIWFLQVTRFSELVTREQTFRLHYFTYSSYKPLQRILPAQMLAGFFFALLLALPLIGRYVVILDFFSVTEIICGAGCIVLLAVFLGIVSGGNKLFEILFFMLTYLAMEKTPMIDYLGASPHENHVAYLCALVLLICCFAGIAFIARNYQSRHL